MLILYAEDEQDDVFFFERALKLAAPLHTLNCVADGEQAIHYLAGEGLFTDRTRHPLPALVLLDINMPKLSGLEVLEWIRRHSHFKSLRVLILTSSSRPEDKARARELGADDYLSKPADPLKLVDLVKSLNERWLR